MSLPIEISEYGNLLMYKPEFSAEIVEDLINSQMLNGLRIFDHWDPIKSTDFLRDFTFLRSLEVSFRHDQDFSFLSDLPQLEHFSLGPSYPMKNRIDLSALINLRYLALQWASNMISGLESCRAIEDLCLIEFPYTDLSLIAGLSKIKRLRIKTGRLKSLQGIEDLAKLEDLEIGNCLSLSSIQHLSGLRNLKRIRIESCRKIVDLDHLRELPVLSILQFVNCGEIPNLDYSDHFPKLEKLELLERTKLQSRADY